MVLISEELIRKKSEHNELIIGTLEELSLHQENIEKIEHIQNWCRELKILLMQNNLIAKLENLSKLKRLEYLNLALNNIERVENLEGLESLTKLDLTLNFIGDLVSVRSLAENPNLKDLSLTGNPCCDYADYRDFVAVAVPQLTTLDGVDIKRADRIAAEKDFCSKQSRILQLQIEYAASRDAQKRRVLANRERIREENAELTEDEINDKFWKSSSEHCPETRNEIAMQQHRNEKRDKTPPRKKPQRNLFAECGRPYHINQSKLDFTFRDEDSHYSLNLAVYKFLDTSLIEVDVQPNYVRVTVKGKIFQLPLGEEVKIDESTSKRSQITGHLLIVMPKLTAKSGIVKLEPNIDLNGKTNVEKTQRASKDIKGTVDISKIIPSNNVDEPFDESEVPDLC